MQQKDVTEESRHWGIVKECKQSQDDFRSGLRLREKVHGG